MLVLSRRLNQTITIGDDIEITVVQIKGGSIRLGIKAPPGIRVHRKEIWELIHDQTRAEGGRPNAAPAAGNNGKLPPDLAGFAQGGSHAAEVSGHSGPTDGL